MAEMECENLALNPKGLTPAMGHLRGKRGRDFTSSFTLKEKYDVPPKCHSPEELCAVNSATQVHCFNVREKRIVIVCFLCYPVLWFMSYSDEAEAEYRHLIYFIVTHSDE